MEQKRKAMDPVPPRPAYAELNLPITLPHGQIVNIKDKDDFASDPEAVEIDRD